MVEKGLETEVKEVLKCIENNENFLLSGGAGSGKTYSLVQIINEVIKLYPSTKIACITYTNTAVNEIEHRVTSKNVIASTIHDFLWNIISNFQEEIKSSLLSLINDSSSKIKNPNGDKEYNNEFVNGIQYKEYLNINGGIISHDEVLILANYMFKEYEKLRRILIDKYKFIFVDEYQDTSSFVIEILLESLQSDKHKNIIGLFGDMMQSIYDDGVGDVIKYIKNGTLKEIKKEQNRRNPQSVINLANKIRLDSLVQKPSNDEDAPNMIDGKIKQGDVKFLYSKEMDIKKVYYSQYYKKWTDINGKNTKELWLTHNLIAGRQGFNELMEIYNSDPIVDFKNKVKNYIRDRNIDINELDSFENVVQKVNVMIGRGNNRRRLIDVKLEDPLFNELYNEIKNWPYYKVKKIYFDKENLIDSQKGEYDNDSGRSKQDALIKHLSNIENLIKLYDDNDYNEFLKRTECKIKTIEDKVKLKNMMSILNKSEDKTIGEIINYFNDNKLYIIDDKLNDFIQNNDYLYNRVKKVKYGQFRALYKYIEGYMPISTQHKIKGMEFNNVLVVLDNGNWSKYNFEYLFNENIKSSLNPARQKTFAKILERTKKLFYVCCTRAKENLIIYYASPDAKFIEGAEWYFGKENVINLD